jgi:hypothetical protein
VDLCRAHEARAAALLEVQRQLNLCLVDAAAHNRRLAHRLFTVEAEQQQRHVFLRRAADAAAPISSRLRTAAVDYHQRQLFPFAADSDTLLPLGGQSDADPQPGLLRPPGESESAIEADSASKHDPAPIMIAVTTASAADAATSTATFPTAAKAVAANAANAPSFPQFPAVAVAAETDEVAAAAAATAETKTQVEVAAFETAGEAAAAAAEAVGAYASQAGGLVVHTVAATSRGLEAAALSHQHVDAGIESYAVRRRCRAAARRAFHLWHLHTRASELRARATLRARRWFAHRVCAGSFAIWAGYPRNAAAAAAANRQLAAARPAAAAGTAGAARLADGCSKCDALATSFASSSVAGYGSDGAEDVTDLCSKAPLQINGSAAVASATRTMKTAPVDGHAAMGRALDAAIAAAGGVLAPLEAVLRSCCHSAALASADGHELGACRLRLAEAAAARAMAEERAVAAEERAATAEMRAAAASARLAAAEAAADDARRERNSLKWWQAAVERAAELSGEQLSAERDRSAALESKLARAVARPTDHGAVCLRPVCDGPVCIRPVCCGGPVFMPVRTTVVRTAVVQARVWRAAV